MASPKQRRFREESDRRFGKLYSYVDEKVRDGFPIQGNRTLARYVGNYLEFLFKRYFIANHLTDEEAEAIANSDTPVRNYLLRQSTKDYSATQTVYGNPFGTMDLGLVSSLLSKGAKENTFGNIVERIDDVRPAFYQGLEGLTIMDVGPAIGAISTLYTLRTLDDYGLLDKVKIHLVDVSEEVLRRNAELDFPNPNRQFVESEFGSVEYFERLKSRLQYAQILLNPADDHIDLPDDSIDIAIASFLLHHIPNESKRRAGNEILRVSRGGVFVVDEYFEDYEQQFAACHAGDQIALAPEEPIPFAVSIIDVLPGLILREGTNLGQDHYAYCGLKHSPAYYDRKAA